jgi:exopolysaccharide biosynthesis polyprenyl glycosylphosphotransferase
MQKLKVFTLFLGDIMALYVSLFLALILRYGPAFYEQFLKSHVEPFTVVFIPWIIIFYVAGLYDLRTLRNGIDFWKVLATSIALAAVVAILLFYFIPAFGIAPKTNLFIFIIIFSVIEILWRRAFNAVTESGEAANKIILVGEGHTADAVAEAIAKNPQFGYAVVERPSEKDITATPGMLDKVVAETHANILVVPRHLKQDNSLARALYTLFARGILILDLPNFYERIIRKVPTADLQEAWFIENIEGTARFYDPLKRAGEFVLALALGIILLPIEIPIAIIVKLTSRGPILIRQQRVGEREKPFMLYKFRSMVALAADGQAETQGAQWASQGDKRVTPFGKFLRATHLDELPQFINLVRGDISFVGPRPERPEFVVKLKEQIPYYEVRLLVKPGVTGWAQINHRADQDLDDVRQKLQYDIYYLKNRSFILDWVIVLKTVKSIFINPK